jgi:hypothetical protein
MHLDLHLRHLEAELLEGSRAAAKKLAVVAAAAEKAPGTYEIQDVEGNWQRLSAADSATVSAARGKGSTACIIEVAGASLQADLANMNAKNTEIEGGVTRTLRKVEDEVAKRLREEMSKTEADHYWGLVFANREVYLLLSEADRALYLALTDEERRRMGEFENEWERLAYLHLDPADRDAFCEGSLLDRMMLAQQAALKGLSPEQLAAFEALSDAERMAFLAMSDAERRAFLMMSEEERAAFLLMDPWERRTYLGMSGAEAAAYLALSSEERRAYMHLDPSQRLAFLLMTEEQRSAFLQLRYKISTTHTHTHAHTHIHTHAHSHIHTHAHSHIHSDEQRKRLLESLSGYSERFLGRTKITPEPLDPLLAAINQAVLRKGLRIKDYFRLVDRSRDGDLDLKELLKALRTEKTMASVTVGEVKALFQYLDIDSSKTVNVKELELALRNYRRDHAYKPLGAKEHALWQKQFEHFFAEEYHEDDEDEDEDEGDSEYSSEEDEAGEVVNRLGDGGPGAMGRRASQRATRRESRRGVSRVTKSEAVAPAPANGAGASATAATTAEATAPAAAAAATATAETTAAAAAPGGAAPGAPDAAGPASAAGAAGPKKTGFLDFGAIRGAGASAGASSDAGDSGDKSGGAEAVPRKTFLNFGEIKGSSNSVEGEAIREAKRKPKTEAKDEVGDNVPAINEAVGGVSIGAGDGAVECVNESGVGQEGGAKEEVYENVQFSGALNVAARRLSGRSVKPSSFVADPASFLAMRPATADSAGQIPAIAEHYVAAVQIQVVARAAFGFKKFATPTAPRIRLSRKRVKTSNATQRKRVNHARKKANESRHHTMYGQYVDPNVMLARVFCAMESALEKSGEAAKALAKKEAGVCDGAGHSKRKESQAKLDAMKVRMQGGEEEQDRRTVKHASKEVEEELERRTGLVAESMYKIYAKQEILAIEAMHSIYTQEPPGGVGMAGVGRRAVEELVLDIDIDGDMAVSQDEMHAAMLSLLLVEGEEVVTVMAREGDKAGMEAEKEAEAAEAQQADEEESLWEDDQFAVEMGTEGDSHAAPGCGEMIAAEMAAASPGMKTFDRPVSPTAKAAAMASLPLGTNHLGAQDSAQEDTQQRVDLAALSRMRELGQALDVYRDCGTDIVYGALAAELKQALEPKFSSKKMPPRVAKALGVSTTSKTVDLALHAGEAAGVCVFDANAAADAEINSPTKRRVGATDNEGDVDLPLVQVPSTITPNSSSVIRHSLTRETSSASADAPELVPMETALSPTVSPTVSPVALSRQRSIEVGKVPVEDMRDLAGAGGNYVSFAELDTCADEGKASPVPMSRVEDELAAKAADVMKNAIAEVTGDIPMKPRKTMTMGVDRRLTLSVKEYEARETVEREMGSKVKDAKEEMLREHQHEEARKRQEKKLARMRARAEAVEAARVRQLELEEVVKAKRNKAAMQWQSYMRVPVEDKDEMKMIPHACLSIEKRGAVTEERVIRDRTKAKQEELKLAGADVAETHALAHTLAKLEAQVQAHSAFRVTPPHFDDNKVTGQTATPHLAELEQRQWDQWADWQQRTEKWCGTPFEGMNGAGIQRMLRLKETGDDGWSRTMGRGGNYLVTPPASRQARLAMNVESTRRVEQRGGGSSSPVPVVGPQPLGQPCFQQEVNTEGGFVGFEPRPWTEGDEDTKMYNGASRSEQKGFAEMRAKDLLDTSVRSGRTSPTPPPSAPLPPSRERMNGEIAVDLEKMGQGMGAMEGMEGLVDAGVELSEHFGPLGGSFASLLPSPSTSPPSTTVSHSGLLPELRATQLLAQSSAMQVRAPAPYHPEWKQKRGLGPAKYGKPNGRERELQRRRNPVTASMSPQPKLLPDYFFDYHKAMEPVLPKTNFSKSVAVRQGARIQMSKALERYQPADAMSKCNLDEHNKHHPLYHRERRRRLEKQQQKKMLFEEESKAALHTQATRGLGVSASAPSALPPLANTQTVPPQQGASLRSQVDAEAEKAWLAMARQPRISMKSSGYVSKTEHVI